MKAKTEMASDVFKRVEELTRPHGAEPQGRFEQGGLSISIGTINGNVVIHHNYGKRRRRERKAGGKTDALSSADGPGGNVANHAA